MAITGTFRRPPVGRFPWPCRHVSGSLPEGPARCGPLPPQRPPQGCEIRRPSRSGPEPTPPQSPRRRRAAARDTASTRATALAKTDAPGPASDASPGPCSGHASRCPAGGLAPDAATRLGRPGVIAMAGEAGAREPRRVAAGYRPKLACRRAVPKLPLGLARAPRVPGGGVSRSAWIGTEGGVLILQGPPSHRGLARWSRDAGGVLRGALAQSCGRLRWVVA
jgi:hypothetical protein